MFKKGLILFMGLLLASSLTGCTAGRMKQKDLEMQGMRNQISVLEAQIQSKEAEISSLRDELTMAAGQESDFSRTARPRKKSVGEVKSRPNIKQIQIALSNAGFDPGAIDGRMGYKTKDAIKAFQRQHNLPADGKVGKKTWRVLRPYLYKKIK